MAQHVNNLSEQMCTFSFVNGKPPRLNGVLITNCTGFSVYADPEPHVVIVTEEPSVVGMQVVSNTYRLLPD